MTLVIDASLVVSALIDAGGTGRWAESQLLSGPLSPVTSYDAWSVALAEFLGCSVATLDRRLARAAGPQCGFQTPPTAT